MGKQAVPLIFCKANLCSLTLVLVVNEVCEGLAMCFSPYGLPYVFLYFLAYIFALARTYACIFAT